LDALKVIQKDARHRRLLGKTSYKRGDSFDHCQWFTMGRLLKMTRNEGFLLIEQENSDFITGTERDIRLTSKLPYWLVSGW
jgi:hypothetical protein